MSRREILAAATMLAAAWRDARTIDGLPEHLEPRDVAEATAIQDEMAAQIGEAVVGWKVAGAPERPCGRIFASTCFANGAAIPAERFPPLHMECEVGFRLRAPLPPRRRSYGRDEVADAADLAVNVELAGSRLTGGKIVPDDARDLARIVADNAVQAGLVTGACFSDCRERSLLGNTVDLRIDDGEPAPAIPVAGRVEPLDVLVWLANDLSRRGIGLDEGQIVTPGSVTVPQRLAAGSRAVAVFEGLDTITLSLAA